MAKFVGRFSFMLYSDIQVQDCSQWPELVLDEPDALIRIVPPDPTRITMEIEIGNGQRVKLPIPLVATQIVIDVELNEAIPDEVVESNSAYRRRCCEIGAKYIARFLEHCRHLINNHWLERPYFTVEGDHLMSNGPGMVLVRWIYDYRTFQDEVTHVGQSYALPEGMLSRQHWETLGERLALDSPLDPLDQVLLDADQHVNDNIPHRAISLMGIALEMLLHRHLRTKVVSTDTESQRILGLKNRSLPEKWLHLLSQHLVGRSLFDDHPHLYERIRELYSARNYIAHEGKCQFDSQSGLVTAGPKEALSLLRHLLELRAWLECI